MDAPETGQTDRAPTVKSLTESEDFDFEKHRVDAESDYRLVEAANHKLADVVRTLLMRALEAKNIAVHSIEARAKGVESFGKKAAQRRDDDPEKPKYDDPISQITDQAACRVITFFQKDVREVCLTIESQFEVVEKTDRSAFRRDEQQLGYESIHYVVRLNADRLGWPEYSMFAGMDIEIRVRTIMQHAWAEIEHDIQYKSVEALPSSIRRRFLALAGMIEIADREFQAIADAHDALRLEARDAIAKGHLENVEITPESLKIFLDGKFGPDGRMGDFSYTWTARNLKRRGFVNLAQLNECIAPYDDDNVSRTMFGSRLGQLSRLDCVLMVSMGEHYISSHPWARRGAPEGGDSEEEFPPRWLSDYVDGCLERIRDAGIPVGSYRPSSEGSSNL